MKRLALLGAASAVGGFGLFSGPIQLREFLVHEPALIVDHAGHLSIDGRGFGVPDRFLRSNAPGQRHNGTLVMEEDGFAVRFEDPDGRAAGHVRSDGVVIGQYMILAQVDRDTTMMIGRKHDVTRTHVDG